MQEQINIRAHKHKNYSVLVTLQIYNAILHTHILD